MKITKGKMLPIGLDLGSSVAKAAQLCLMENEIELLAVGAIEVPRSIRADIPRRLDLLSTELRKLMKSGRFKGARCILSLPAEETFVHHVRIPKVAPGDMSSAVEAELSGKLPYAVEDAVVRHVIVGEVYGEGEAKQEVLTVSTPGSTLESYLAMARRAKLDVVGINVESCAVVECFARLFRRESDSGRTILYVDLGSVSTQVVLSRGPRIVFARNLAFGGEKFDRTVAEQKDISLEEANALRRYFQAGERNEAELEEFYRALDEPVRAVAEELTQCLRYYESVFRNQGIERAIFVGGQAYDKRLCQAIAQRLNVPAQIGDPLIRVKRVDAVGLDAGLDRREPQPDWAVAVGLSLGAALAA